MKAKRLLICFVFFYTYMSSFSQDLAEEVVADSVRKKGVVKQYSYFGRYDGSLELILFKGNKYRFIKNVRGGPYISEGTWRRKNDLIVLTNTFIDSLVPFTITPLDSSLASTRKTQFLIPVNLKGEEILDSRIYLNNDSSFCFPYFDTCVGFPTRILEIKVDFGDGFKSKWMRVQIDNNRTYQIVANIAYNLRTYMKFYRRKYQIIGSSLKLISSDEPSSLR